MISKDEARARVKELVEEFSEFSKVELDKKSEVQIQYEFIDELFGALGWDMRKDVEREERVLKGRADYIFRLGNQEALVVEAKKTSVSLGEEQIKSVDWEIDREVYGLYGLSAEEIGVVEGRIKNVESI